MHKIAVIGNMDSIYGFSSLGIEIFPVNSSKDALFKLKELSLSFGVIFMVDFFNNSEDEIVKEFNDKIVPSIVFIKGMSSNVSTDFNNLKNLVKKAVGFDMLEKIV